MGLLPHQREDAQFLADRSFAGCFSGMGTGKTLTALEAARLLGVTPTQRLLVVGPPIALPMWQREIAAWLGLDAQILKTGKTKVKPGTAAIICSYEIAVSRQRELGDLVRGGLLVCDESHALKNPKAKRTKAILGKGGIASYASHSWMLTGTPVVRWNDDLYPFLCRADMAGLKQRTGGVSKERFDLRYCVTQKRQFPGARFPTKLTVGNMKTDELNEWIYGEGLAVRRELKDVWKQMPPLTENRYVVPMQMSPELKEAMAGVKDKSVAQIQQMLSSDDQSLSTLRRLIGQAKAPASAKVIRERIEEGHGPLLVGVWHTGVIDSMARELREQKLRVDVIDGRVSSAKKSKAEAAFNAGEIDVLLGQIGAMGVSLNLQELGHRILVVEEDWSPAVMDQFYGRLYRMGQKQHVHIDILYSENKIEEAIARIAATKRREHGRVNRQEGKA